MIKRTLLRLIDVTRGMFRSSYWIPLLLEGLAVEFGRLNTFRKKVYVSVVPNENMDADTFSDNLKKYGLEYLSDLTDEEKIDHLIAARSLSGYSGPEYLEEQLQALGLMFYLHTNSALIDPATVPGELIVGTHPEGLWYEHTADNWNRYFFLSPYADRLATVAELPSMTLKQYNILKKLIIALKFQRDWCILQVNSRQYLDGELYLNGEYYLDGFATTA